MNWITGIHIAAGALLRNKLRSALAMLGVMVGVAAVITMIAIGSGARARVQDQIDELGSHLITVAPASITFGGVRIGAGTRMTLTEDDADALPRELPDVEAVAPTLRGSGHMVFGSRNWMTSFHGSTPDFFVVRNWPLASGRGFTESELRGAAKVVLLGESVAAKLFGSQDPVGKVVRVRTVPMEVIGVLTSKGRTLDGHDYDDMILIPITTARKRILGGSYVKQQAVHYISVKVKEGADRINAAAEIRSLLRWRHRIALDRDDDFTLRSAMDVVAVHDKSTRAMTILLASIASVSLLVGGIVIMNMMLVTVTERTREIGLRMAVGARRKDILSQFLIEALAITLLSAIFGIVLGVSAAYSIGVFGGWRTHITVDSIALAAGSAALVGVLFGLYPACKASRLSPIDALGKE